MHPPRDIPAGPAGPARLVSLALALGASLSWGGCGPKPAAATAADAPPKTSFTASKVRSFSDTYAVTSVSDSPSTLWVGTTRGLLRWDLSSQAKYTVASSKDGLPADRIVAVAGDATGQAWVVTQKGLARGGRPGAAWQTLPAPPVGDFLGGLVPTSDGKTLWAGGPEGLARLRLSTGTWEHFLADVTVTALAMGENNVLWVGTAGRGVLRVAGDKVEPFGAQQGSEVDVVRGLAAFGKGVLAVGEGPNGPRLALYDRETDRFFSYISEGGKPALSFAARGGAHLYVGAGGGAVLELTQYAAETDPATIPAGTVKLTARPVGNTRPPRPVALKPDLPATALDDTTPAAAAKPAASSKKNGRQAPLLVATDAGFQLPDGLTATASSERGLLVGTRFLGAERIENGVLRRFRTNDLAAGAERLTVACQGEDCYLATGGARAWRFDGQAFEIAAVDPEPGARVLAVLNEPNGGVLAIHRGAADGALRLSTVAGNAWTPVGIQSVQVPFGAPELNFAVFAPTGALWVGLRYLDKDKDAVDYGAAEIHLESGKVVYHRQGAPAGASAGFELPSDMVAMWFRSKGEAWFATRQGAARLQDGKVRVFTENDGMESDIVRDIGPGPGGSLSTEIWVATGRGVGKYDGARWSFPKMGPFYLKTSAIANDDAGHVFLGTEKGVFCVGDCEPDGIDARRGLAENSVLDVTVDARGRVWALTARGVSIIEP